MAAEHTRGKGTAASTQPSARAYLVALFVVYLLLLIWVVLWKLNVPWIGGDRAIKLVPFARTGEAGASAPVEVLVNLMIFIPLGVHVGLLAPARACWTAIGAAAGTSLALEATQYVLAVGRSDITDVLVNTAGGLIGLGVLALAQRRLQARTAKVMTRICSIGTAVTVLSAGLYLTSPWQPVHTHDVGSLSNLHAPGNRSPAAPRHG
jgi:glycopeptide antibiotics resistance protein